MKNHFPAFSYPLHLPINAVADQEYSHLPKEKEAVFY